MRSGLQSGKNRDVTSQLAASRYPLSFSPVSVGTMELDRRLVVSSHSGGGGSLLGSEALFERHCTYWVSRIDGGIRWVGGGPTFVRNPLIPGFEPTGVGSNGPGLFREPNFVERLGRFMARLHGAGGFGSVQFVQQGGMPSAPSNTLSGYAEHRIPHALDVDQVQWLVREYGESAALAAEGDADALELHANHDDVLQWFLSPKTNHRTDGYGGSFENRRRFLREVVESMRAHVQRPITIGLRLCIDEMIDGGQTLEDCQAVLAAFTTDGTVDYFSLDVGDNWGRVSYIQPGFYDEGQWAPMAGQARTATDLPVVYVGRVTSVETAERILADGHADLVGFARATIADPDLVVKSLEAREPEVRPCIGVQECIDRRVVEGLPFACGVNPHAGREDEGRPPRAAVPRSVLVIGGGPAGTEFAGQMAERGHGVQLWERSGALGGQLAVAAQLRMNANFAKWIRWQEARLGRVGVEVHLDREATAARSRRRRRGRRRRRHRRRRPERRRARCRSATRDGGDGCRDGCRARRPSGRGDLRRRPLGAAGHRRPPRRGRPRGHAGVPDARPLPARRQVHDRRRHGPPRRAWGEDGADDAPGGDRARAR